MITDKLNEKPWISQVECNARDFTAGSAVSIPAGVTKVLIRNESEEVIFYTISSGTVTQYTF